MQCKRRATGGNPTTPTVSFSTVNLLSPSVYGMRDGLGDLAQTSYKPMPPFNCYAGYYVVAEEPIGELRTSVYPNPISSTFTLNYHPVASGEQLAVTLYNAQDTVAFSQLWEGAAASITQKHRIPQMPTGTYFLRTVANGRTSQGPSQKTE